ncbi:diadenosine tetraphosphate (Ap4A) hydrolase and other HIT family hydrolases [Coriobacteriaceae bacterium EMTCatB1]|nr:diadenosine tetraphosphate (Ap4A) hydrolase and other HIT family hydrolases [Coriobacteriaceae bacterium EMTCatB1]
MSECVFCMIARGEIPAKVVYEDDQVLAFDDIAPQAPVHTLIIPKEHFDRMGPDVPAEVISALFTAVPKVAEAKGVAESGYRVIVNNGPDAMQTVGHLHVHVIGGKRMSHGMVHFE